MKRTTVIFLILLGSSLLLVGCGGDDSGSDNWGTDGQDTGPSGIPPVPWDIEKVTNISMGEGLDLVVDANDALHLAYYELGTFLDTSELCATADTFAEDDDLYRRNLRYAMRGAADSAWTEELIYNPRTLLSPHGIDLEINPNGDPAVAYTGGENPGFSYCGSNDGVIATRGASGWTNETFVATGDQAIFNHPSSDFGEIVGYWPSLAYDRNGDPAAAYKDVHNVVLQHDDRYRADAEIAFGGGGWTHEGIDGGAGAGDYNSLLFDNEGRAVVFYAVTVHANEIQYDTGIVQDRFGVWAARRETDGTWVRTTEPIHDGNIGTEISSALHPTDGSLAVAFYNGESNPAVRVMRLTDATQFEDPTAWDVDYVMDPRYQEGNHVSMAFAPDGSLAVAYHRCKLLTSDGGCNKNDEGVIFGIEKNGKWSIEVVDAPGLGNCGEFASLAFASDGTAHIAYRCTVEIKADDTDNAGSQYGFRLFVASKKVVEL